MSISWQWRVISWREPTSWTGILSRWLRPYLSHRGIRHLRQMGEQDICWDDSEWLNKAQTILRYDVEYVTQSLGAALIRATIRTYHGCRPKDVGSYLREGILLNNPDALAEEARRIVAEEEPLHYLNDVIEQRLQEFKERERDIGRLYLALDDRTLTNMSGHYVLYGSEWILSVLGFEAHAALRRRGTPTILLVDLPLHQASDCQRQELSKVLLQEWTRIKVNNPDHIPERDFSFIVRESISRESVTGHYHPEAVRDPFYQRILRHVDRRSCEICPSGPVTNGGE